MLFKALHLIFMVTWFAGLFYLPRLFVYHAMSDDVIGIARFKIMERKLFYGIMTPGGVLTLLSGAALFAQDTGFYAAQLWFQLKLGLVALLVIYHIYCGVLINTFRDDKNTRSHVWYRWFNEIPVVFLIAIILLAVYRPG
ncbi:MAG: CopD family protein [Gammaproteobacteria bacterium]